MPTEPRRLDALGFVLPKLEQVKDPLERIRSIRALRDELSSTDDRLTDLLRLAILEARALTPPPTWQEIGDLLNVSAQRAYQLAQPTTDPTKEPATA